MVVGVVESAAAGVGASATGAEAPPCPSGRNSSTSSPSFPMAATVASTGTSSSASQKRASTDPEAVDSRSKLALSVSITASTSPSATWSPTFTFHSVRMQLSTDCPWRGIITGVAMSCFLLLLLGVVLNKAGKTNFFCLVRIGKQDNLTRLFRHNFVGISFVWIGGGQSVLQAKTHGANKCFVHMNLS